MYIFVSIKSIKIKSKNRKIFLSTLNIYKIYINHENKKNITQSPGTHIFIIYLREIIDQRLTKSWLKEEKKWIENLVNSTS